MVMIIGNWYVFIVYTAIKFIIFFLIRSFGINPTIIKIYFSNQVNSHLNYEYERYNEVEGMLTVLYDDRWGWADCPRHKICYSIRLSTHHYRKKNLNHMIYIILDTSHVDYYDNVNDWDYHVLKIFELLH